MGLRSKLIISLFIVAMAMISAIHYYWMPNYLAFETEQQIEQEENYISLLSVSLEGDILSNDLVSIYQTLDDIKESRSNWYALKIINQAGQRLYPLEETSVPAGIITHAFDHPIMNDNQPLVNLQVSVDVMAPLQHEIEYIEHLEWLLAVIILIASLVAYLMQENWIIRPLRGLGRYSKAIAEGDYSRKLEYQSHDELGSLVDAFNTMRKQVKQREEILQSDNEINELIRTIQRNFISDKDKHHVFAELQQQIVQITGSEFGFIGEVLYDFDGAPYLKTFAVTNIAWNEETRVLYEESQGYNMEFRNLNTLFGHVLSTEKVVVSNDPTQDSRSGGLLPGHPPLNSFLGVPIFSGNQMVGMLGLGNRKNGYDESLRANCQMLLSALGSLIIAYRDREAMVESEARFRSVVDTAVDGIISIDSKGIIKMFNRAAERIFGYSTEQVKGKNIKMLMPIMDREKHDDYLARFYRTGESRVAGLERQLEGMHKNGNTFPIELSIAKVKMPDGIEFTGVVRDISERKQNEEQIRLANESLAKANNELKLLSRSDALTGLFNRRHFDETLSHEIRRNARNKLPLSLIMADIDFFKPYNDHYGHQAGDDCIRQVASSMCETFHRSEDVVARYGGEEFAVIVPGLSEEEVYSIAERMRVAVEACALPHEQSTVSKVVTISVGVTTIIPTKTTKSKGIIEMADKALYLAKSEGRNNVQC